MNAHTLITPAADHRALEASRSFTFTTYLTRGHAEREIEVEATYGYNGCEVVLTDAKDKTEGRELTDWEWESVYDAACERCDADWSEYRAEYGEYLRDQMIDRRAAA